jgi:phosphohistidine phosphatase
MQLFLFRHAKAEAMGRGGGGDSQRPLSEAGRELFAEAALLWSLQQPAPERILASPLLRAQETAEMLQQAWKQRGDEVEIDTEPAVTPEGDPQSFLDLLPELESVAIVSHMPFIGALAGELLTDSPRDIWFKTGTGILVEYDALSRTAKFLMGFGTKEARDALQRMRAQTQP